MRVALLSEGPTELGTPSGERADESWPRVPALQVLVERILGLDGGIEPWVPDAIRGGGAGAVLSQGQSLVLAGAREGCQAAVLLVDADLKANMRLRRLREIRAAVAQARPGLAIPVAVGVAAEKFEAWLLADELHLCRVLGLPNPSEPLRDPESWTGMGGAPDDAKTVLGQYLARDHRGPRAFLDVAGAIVREMDLDVVARRCPHGFAPFVAEVRTRLGPLTR